MGCLFCNITNVGSRATNPFFCKTEQERDEIREELAYDIAYSHPEILKKINHYVKKLKRVGVENFSSKEEAIETWREK